VHPIFQNKNNNPIFAKTDELFSSSSYSPQVFSKQSQSLSPSFHLIDQNQTLTSSDDYDSNLTIIDVEDNLLLANNESRSINSLDSKDKRRHYMIKSKNFLQTGLYI
jgi:hypothetical protein